MVGVGSILLVVVGLGLLQKYAGLDMTVYIPWAVSAIAGLCGLTQGTIMHEDIKKAQASAHQD